MSFDSRASDYSKNETKMSSQGFHFSSQLDQQNHICFPQLQITADKTRNYFKLSASDIAGKTRLLNNKRTATYNVLIPNVVLSSYCFNHVPCISLRKSQTSLHNSKKIELSIKKTRT